MAATVKSQRGTKLTLEIEVDISGSMLEAEEKIQQACNELGALSTTKALEQFDTDGSPIMIGEKKIYGEKSGK